MEIAESQHAAIDAAKAMIESHLQENKVLASVRDNAKDASSALTDFASAAAAASRPPRAAEARTSLRGWRISAA